MGLFGKKRAKDKVSGDKDLIEENAKAIEALLILAENNEEMKSELKSAQEKIKYLPPSEDSKIFDFDKKIKNLIEDMRIALVKADGESSKKVENVLTQIKLTIADRNTKF